MSTPEGKVKQKLRTWMKRELPGAWHYCPAGGGFSGQNGMPDDVWLWRGVFVAVESKPDRREPTDLQKAQLKKIRDAGGVTAVMYGFEEWKLHAIKERVIRMTPNWGLEGGDSQVL